MKIRTDKGQTISVNFAIAPTTGGSMMVKMPDDGTALSEICAAFENVERFECREEIEGAPLIVYEGYTKVMRVSRENGAIMVTLRREG